MHRLILPILGSAAALAGQWRPPTAAEIRPPQPGGDRFLSCTPAELAALRAAHRHGAAPVVGRVRAARSALQAELEFPPRGGQHNQWYQCDDCQFPLQTVDATHHRCRKCRKVYSGPPYDDVLFSRVHARNWQGARDAAWAFAITGEPAFAAHTGRVLLGYAERYRNYPYHTANRSGRGPSGGHLLEQTLSEASLAIDSILPAFDLVRSTLTQAQREQILDGLLRPLLRNIARCRRGKSNWQSFHNAALFLGGAVSGDGELMRRALLDPKDGFVTQMRISVSAEGMWYENSWAYHFYTLRALVATAEAARRCGIDLWGHPVLRRMLRLPARYAMAGERMPRFGDDVNTSLRHIGALLEAAHAATGDPELLPVLPGAASWQSILAGRKPTARAAPAPRKSAVFRGAGHALLRSDGPGQLEAAFTFGPFGGFHGHFDKLSFVWFGYGEELGVDPGRARSQAYRLPVHTRWYRATLSHNTVVVDGRSQRGAAGELLLFDATPQYSVTVARCDQAYDGVDHRRCLLLTGRYLVVLDRLESTSPRRFTWLYHNRGRAVTCAQADRPPVAIDLDGAEFLAADGSGPTLTAIHAVFEGATAGVHLHLAAAGPTAVHRGTGVGATVLDRVPVLIAERRGKHQEFAAVLSAHPTGQPGGVTAIRSRRQDGSTVVEVLADGHIDRIRWDGAAQVRFESGR